MCNHHMVGTRLRLVFIIIYLVLQEFWEQLHQKVTDFWDHLCIRCSLIFGPAICLPIWPMVFLCKNYSTFRQDKGKGNSFSVSAE